MRRAFLLILLGLALSFSSGAEGINFRGGARYSRLSNVDNAASTLLKTNGYPSFDIALGWSKSPADSSIYADAWNYPIFGIGASVNAAKFMKFQDNIRYSNFYNLYAFTEWDYYRTATFSAGLYVELGLGYFDSIYDKVNNPNQIFLGSRGNIFIGFGPYIKWRPAPQWEIGLSPVFWHHSSGRLSVPNLGLNEYGVELFARYYVKPLYSGGRRFKGEYHFDRKFSWNLFASGTRYISRAQWFAVGDNTTYRLRASLGASAMWKITSVFSTGAELELNYTSDAKDLAGYDKILYGQTSSKGYHPFYVGLASANELYLGRNISMVMCLGLYLHRELGIEERESHLYQKIGARYYFEKLANTFIGFNVRAFNFGKADNMEFYVGKRF